VADIPQDKLRGWKEIADYLGTSARTVQRWEAELGFPVHRVPGGHGHFVFAFSQEISEWLGGPGVGAGRTLAAASEPEPAPVTSVSDQEDRSGLADVEGPRPEPLPHDVSRDRQTPPTLGAEPQAGRLRIKRVSLPATLGGILVLFLALSILAVVLLRGRFQEVDVGQVTILGRQLLAWKDGKIAWSFDFDQPLAEANAREVNRRVRIEDLNNDGRKEVLVAAPLLISERGDSSSDALYCFSSYGKELWHHSFQDRLRFSGDDAGPRWEISALMVTRNGATASVWSTICESLLSTSVLYRFDVRGGAAPYFVNYGHLRSLNRVQTASGSYILAGGINNEANCGMLAVLKEGGTSGHSPSMTPSAECAGCPKGEPYRYFLFPRTEICRMIGPPYNNICNILNTDGHLQLMSLETADAQSDSPQDWALYALSPDFVPEKVILSDHYWEDHRRLSAEG